MNIGDNLWPLLVYISGYCSYAAIKKLLCEYCRTFLTAECCDSGELIAASSRGSLCYPEEDVLTCVVYTFVIVQKLLKEPNERVFLQQRNQRHVVVTLTIEALSYCELLLGHDCHKIGHSTKDIVIKIVTTATNILLNNYVKKMNDKFSKKTVQQLKRPKICK